MDSTMVYEYILSRINDDLTPFGYCRSGKSTLFYRYSLDKKVACCIELQKSMFNSPESYSFTFNLLCVGIYDLDGYFNDKLTISAVKKCFQNPFITERIGFLCRSRDYWWEITDDILQECTVEEYYSQFIHNDIEKSAYHLKELSEKKSNITNNLDRLSAMSQQNKAPFGVLFCLSKPQGLVYHHRAKRGVYRQPPWCCISSRASVYPSAA